MARQATRLVSNWPFPFSVVPGRPGLIKNVNPDGSTPPTTEQFKSRRVRIKPELAAPANDQVGWNFRAAAEKRPKPARVKLLPPGMRGVEDAPF